MEENKIMILFLCLKASWLFFEAFFLCCAHFDGPIFFLDQLIVSWVGLQV